MTDTGIQTDTLHEQASKSFRRTPNGLIFSEDLRAVYSVFLICLNLQDVDKESKKGVFPFQKTVYPFSFSIQDAVEIMKHLELQVDMSVTCISISYTIQPEMAYYLLEIFMAAKLLHTPADRTRSLPKDKVLLQPTPKGVAILQKYVRDVGLKKIPDILTSDFSSMELFSFERSSETDSIIHSDYLIHILFITMMGISPNVWSPSNPNDKIPCLSKLLEYNNNDDLTFENLQFTNFNQFQVTKREEEFSWQDHISEARLHDEKRTSPFAHRFFTNPDSDSHVQYYTSDCGLRIFKGRSYGPNKTLIDFSFTTKALWQWLMDCTDIMYPKEAVSVAAIFFKCGLIIPILDNPSQRSRFYISRSCHYTFSRRGWDVCQWNIDNVGDISSCTSSTTGGSGSKRCRRESHFFDTATAEENIFIKDTSGSDSDKTIVSPEYRFKEFDDILNDPGMRYLFRRHLENEFCVENLDAYFEIKKFVKKIILLEKLNNARNSGGTHRGGKGKVSDIKAVIDAALAKQTNECLEIGYHIYASYIAVGAPYQLNIDHTLRESISTIMLQPKLPLSKKFSFKIDVEDILSINEGNLGIATSPLQKPEPALLRESLSQTKTKKGAFVTKHIFNPTDVDSEVEEEVLPREFPSTSQFAPEVHEDETLGTANDMIRALLPLFETLNQSLYRLMKVDSLQKFLNSSVYQEAVTLADI
ncbi:hypothetical protein ZYGR_0AK00590 [Zygosaccharomyces rouxii]|uniref:RGS domain-containing protein n=1 Tax=Zygosaccharomyces rouxii TaxID=4956 RepID=A0A1Q3ACV3_ZYGRO|nr:hypothetical protein ZYGR_0AK00590 [Zygosaccharomyces rouxii]